MSRRTRRWLFFGLTILVGVAAGLVYGWVVNPITYTDTTPITLREDYQADIALMIAEGYQADGDATLALARLTYFSAEEPVTLLDRAIRYGEDHHYAAKDLQLMRKLAQTIALLPPEVQ